MKTRAVVAVIGVLALAWAAYAALSGSVFAQEPVHIRWVVAHEPTSLFNRAQHTFADVFNANSDGMRIDIVGLGPKDFGTRVGGLDRAAIFKLLDTNEVQIASISVAYLRQVDPELGVLALPYLFSSYKAAEPVLEGPVGQRLLEGVSATTTGRALAFTYSGGFELIQTSGKTIHSAADMRGLRVGTPNGPLAEDILRSMGATPVHIDASLNSAAMQHLLFSGDVDGLEYTYPRLYFATTSRETSVINETYHSLFLTALVVSDSFYDSLSETNKAAFRKASLEAARVEREDSIALGEATKAALIAKGDTIITPDSSLQKDFVSRTKSVIARYKQTFGADLIRDIVTAQQ